MAPNERPSLFISHAHTDTELAHALHELIDAVFHRQLVVSYSASKGARGGIPTGTNWLEWIGQNISTSRVTFVLLTPQSVESEWVIWEAGVVFGYSVLRDLTNRKGNRASSNAVRPLLYNVSPERIPEPMKSLQATRGDSADEIRRAIKELVDTDYADLIDRTEHVEAIARLDKAVGAYEDTVRRVASREQPIVSASGSRLARSFEHVKRIPSLQGNTLFDILVAHALDRWSRLLDEVALHPSSLRLPYVLYPDSLLRLMMVPKTTIKAIAVVDEQEAFWRGRLGETIRELTYAESTRVFVYRNPKHLSENMPILWTHARAYNVYAKSYDDFVRDFPNYSHDFSIIGEATNRVLARYAEETDHTESIQFCTDEYEIKLYEQNFQGIVASAVRVNALRHDDPGERKDEQQRLVDQVFTSPMTMGFYEKRHVEMSAYIEIDQYDQHEEKHAYFVEMMKKMIDICEDARRNGPRPTAIVEFGAGTGILTKRLAQLDNAEITAIEIDWACVHKLRENVQSVSAPRGANTTVVCHHQDSRTYDPGGPEKRYHFVMSSFADHHIKRQDKRRYFENVKRNLEPGALFIVGDEFLPPHDEDDRDQRARALKAYHGHIIDIAESAGEHVLAKLESEALQSGLDEIGDFKLTCRRYEELVRNAGFDFRKDLIGPQERTMTSRVGGIYVYTMWLP